MDLKKLFNDDDAVSPVIGVILMVAITVILAAVIASFVLGLGDQASEATPQASFSFDYDSGDLEVTHDGGDSIESARVTITGDGLGSDMTFHNDGTVSSSSDDITAGDSASTTTNSVTTNSGQNVQVVWEDADEETSATLAEYEIT